MDDPRKLLVESGYDALGEAYADWSARVEGDPRDRYLDDVSRRLPAGSRVLDLGCGSGLPSTKLVAERFEVLGVDVSATQIDCARGAGVRRFRVDQRGDAHGRPADSAASSWRAS
jgi:SAM-dependent methyltransferase